MTEIIRRARPERIAKGLYWDRALSLVEGCACVSEGCANCWAAAQTHTRSGQSNPKIKARYGGLTDGKGRWTGEVRLMWGDLEKPPKVRRPTVWAVWNDLFHEDVPIEFHWRFLDVVARCRRHTFLVLTKRPDRMSKFVQGFTKTGMDFAEFMPNLWLGTSIESPDYLWRAEELVQVPAAVRYISYEPALGPVDLSKYFSPFYCRNFFSSRPLDWVIVGGESGPRPRPMAVAWAREILELRCARFFKQWGDAFPGPICADTGLPLLGGRVWAEFPEAA